MTERTAQSPWHLDSGWESPDVHRKLNRSDARDLTETLDPCIGSGALGAVQEVKIKGGEVNVVRKYVHLKGLTEESKRRKRTMIQDEAEALRRLKHSHIVSLIGTYEEVSARRDPVYSLLMAPVGESGLGTFLQNILREDCDTQITHRTWIRGWFTCLASAIDYVHRSGVRHEDIKPPNIIHRGNRVYLTDFSSATRFKGWDTTSTGKAARTTIMYAAPESNRYAEDGSSHRHGSQMDVFSLGCVYAEMLAVMSGNSIVEKEMVVE